MVPATMIQLTVRPVRVMTQRQMELLNRRSTLIEEHAGSPSRASAWCLPVLGQGGCITPCSGWAAVPQVNANITVVFTGGAHVVGSVIWGAFGAK